MGTGVDGGAGGLAGRLNQSIVGGLALIALSAIALWGLAPLGQGTLRAMGPGLLPRALAAGVGACGIALVGFGLIRLGEKLSGVAWRGAILVPAAIALFALTIRPFDLGFATTPGLGLIVAGPLAVIVGGFATPEAKLKELVPLAFMLTAVCMVLFGDLLNLPIPNYPRSLATYFPAGWSQHAVLRALAAILFGAGLLLTLPALFARREGGRP